MMAKQISLAVVAVAIMLGMSKLQPHNEEALLSDWSTPPPWPIFIAVNVLAGALRAAADALTPPPFKILDMIFGAHQLNWCILLKSLRFLTYLLMDH
jgi:hypothetical protein